MKIKPGDRIKITRLAPYFTVNIANEYKDTVGKVFIVSRVSIISDVIYTTTGLQFDSTECELFKGVRNKPGERT